MSIHSVKHYNTFPDEEDTLITPVGPQALGPINEEPQSWCGRLLTSLTDCLPSTNTVKSSLETIGLAASTAIGLGAVGYSAYEFATNGYKPTPTLVTASLAGASLVGALWAKAPPVVPDTLARWLFEGAVLEENALSNGLSPIGHWAAWSLNHPPEGVRFATTSLYYSTASAAVVLRLRNLFGQKQRTDDLLRLYDPEKGPNILFLESTTQLNRRFLRDQCIKGIACAAMITVASFNPIPDFDPMAEKLVFDSGLLLGGSIPGSTLASLYLQLEKRVSPTSRLRVIGKVADVVSSLGIGAVTSLQSKWGFIPMGFFMGVKKILEQSRYEQLTENPDKELAGDFDWKDPYTYIKGAELAVAIGWYAVGVTNEFLGHSHKPLAVKVGDAVNIGSMFAGAFLGYPAQRALLRQFDPTNPERSGRNSAAFYTAYVPMAIYPFLVRRFAGSLDDCNPAATYTQMAIDALAWFSWGFGWGSARARYGIREKRSPSEVTLQMQSWAGKVLSSNAHFAEC